MSIPPEMASANMLIIITIILVLPTAQSRTNVTLGSSLLANKANSTWLSPSAEFAFGFQLTAAGYLLAIWFDKIPEKTIIWSANRDRPAPEGSTVRLSANGRLELNGPRGEEMWSPASGAAYAAMLDTGNFAVFSATSESLWQSFDVPTDTLVPSQTLNRGGELIASFSQRNSSLGRFMLSLQSDGNLVLQTRNFPMNDPIKAYWATDTVGDGFRLIFNDSGYLNLVAQNGTLLTNLYGASRRQHYQRLTLEYDGVLRHYLYPKSSNSTGWSVDDFLPSNICTQISQGIGGGACGLNSLCSMENGQRPQCSCPPGYSAMDPDNWGSGCNKDFAPQSCDRGSPETDMFGFRNMLDADWPFSDYAHFTGVTEDWCRHDCLTDCFCDVAIYSSGGECWKKRLPLSNGRIDSSVQRKALIKVRTTNATVATPSGGKPHKRNDASTLIIIGAILLGISVLFNLLLLVSKLFFGRKSKRDIEEEGNRAHPGLNIRCFSYKALEEATNGFREELGSGAYSTVYKGTLKDEKGKVVAVKKLDRVADGAADQEFRAEVSSISKTNHKNLVQLLGYCEQGQNRLLVYEFMSNGSLADFLFGRRPNWYTRVQIAFAVARGLTYLHEECTTQIIHCDIKPQNVLLNDTHTAKISDFGLAKLLMADQTRTTTGIRGTRGYVAPEWFRSMPITVKVDVYSYGIMLLELLCCRKNFEADVEDERKKILSDWAYDCCCQGAVEMLVEGDEQEVRDDMKRFEIFVKIGLWCIQEDPELRPHMKRVVHMLEGSAQVPPPPGPGL